MKIIDGELNTTVLENFVVFAYQNGNKKFIFEHNNVVMKKFHFWRNLIFGYAFLVIASSLFPAISPVLVLCLLTSFFVLILVWLFSAKCEFQGLENESKEKK